MAEPHRFRSFGCEIAVSGGDEAQLAAIELLFEERDRIFSRFRADSELNRVNAASGDTVRVSPAFAELLGAALEADKATRGLVTPTLGAEIEAAGYDDDFDRLEDNGSSPVAVARRPRTVRLLDRTLLVAEGVRLDLNGVVKGRTVDDALALLDGDGFVAAGGDLAVSGTMVVALPHGGTVTLVDGGMATSGTDRRRWTQGGAEQHHLIDPRTGEPASSPWEQVTVCANSCLRADVEAKAAFLLGAAGPKWLDERELPGRFVTAAGELITNRAWQRSLGAGS